MCFSCLYVLQRGVSVVEFGHKEYQISHPWERQERVRGSGFFYVICDKAMATAMAMCGLS